jgi:UDP-glucose 4-epimerase
MNILSIGGAGYIGSIVSKYLLDNFEHCNVKVFDNLSTGNQDIIKHLDKSSDFILGDILDTEHLTEVLVNHNIDVVLNFASLSLICAIVSS